MAEFMTGFATCWAMGALFEFRMVARWDADEAVRAPLWSLALMAMCWPYTIWMAAEIDA